MVIAGVDTELGPLYNEMRAASTLVMIPTVLLTPRLERLVVRGPSLGAVTGQPIGRTHRVRAFS